MNLLLHSSVGRIMLSFSGTVYSYQMLELFVFAGLADGVWVWKQSHGDAAWAEFENAQYVDIPETPREHKQYKNASEMELILRMPEFSCEMNGDKKPSFSDACIS